MRACIMLFSSYIFIRVFLPVTLIVYRLLCLRRHPSLPFLWLVVASFFFYGWWNPIHVTLLMASIVANYLIGLRLTALASQSRLATGQPRLADVALKKRRLLIAGIAGNLLVLAYFKYSVFI